MLELPESFALAQQVRERLIGKGILSVAANRSPHKFAWFFGEAQDYPRLLQGRAVDGAAAWGGFIEIRLGDMRLVFGDGVRLRLYPAGEPLPEKHQLCLGLDDGSSLLATVQMYGGIWAFQEGENDNPYYLVAREKPSPLTDAFDEAYFASLLEAGSPKLSAKAFLATEQRIPGLGNGCLQDILFAARVHPKKKIGALSDGQLDGVYHSVKQVLAAMAQKGGRDTETGLGGQPGGYTTILSKNTWRSPCPVCGGEILRQAYLGGNVYICPACQPE